VWCPVIAYRFEFGGRRLQAGSMTARISLIQGERAVIDRPYSLRFSLRIPNYETPHQSPGPGRHIGRDVATDLSRRGSLIVRRGRKALINQASWPRRDLVLRMPYRRAKNEIAKFLGVPTQ